MLDQKFEWLNSDDLYELSATCYDCKATQCVLVSPPELERYQSGELVQKVWPDCDTWWREVVIGWRTGWFQCQSCCESDIQEGKGEV